MKSRISILISSIFLLSGLSFAQVFQADEWCSNYPAVTGSGVLWGHASCVLGDTIYVVGGSGTGAPSTTVVKFSMSGNTWSAGTSLPGPKAGGDLVAVGINKLYYIGGGNAAVTAGTPEQYVYDRTTGMWTTIANIPTPVTGNVAERWNDSLIYCMLGGWTSYLTTIQIYSVNTNTWTTGTPITAGNGRRSFAGGILGNTLYVCAGYSGVFRNDFWKGVINPSNPTQITWTSGPTIISMTSRPGGTAINGRFYVVVGEITGGMGGGIMSIYDTTANTWTDRPGNPFAGSNYWGAISASITNCAGRTGVKVWIPGGAIGTLATRPLTVYADTCLLNCNVVGISGNNNEIPAVYSLSQNYPNPFNPNTAISFSIPKAGDVKLVVTDVLGREVAVLVDQFQTAGVHNVVFDASSHSSGVYFYTLTAGDFKETKKMLLIK